MEENDSDIYNDREPDYSDEFWDDDADDFCD